MHAGMSARIRAATADSGRSFSTSTARLRTLSTADANCSDETARPTVPDLCVTQILHVIPESYRCRGRARLETMGGQIGISSTEEEGSVFVVALPRAPCRAPPAASCDR